MPSSLSPTAQDALRQHQLLSKELPPVAPQIDVMAVAMAMSKRRKELQHQPLDLIWQELAKAAIEAM